MVNFCISWEQGKRLGYQTGTPSPISKHIAYGRCSTNLGPLAQLFLAWDMSIFKKCLFFDFLVYVKSIIVEATAKKFIRHPKYKNIKYKKYKYIKINIKVRIRKFFTPLFALYIVLLRNKIWCEKEIFGLQIYSAIKRKYSANRHFFQDA